MRTIPGLFEESVIKFGDNPFLWEKTNAKYESLSYKEVRDEVYKLAAGLKALGIKKNDKVALISEGRNYWVISELAVLYLGAVNVPLSVKLEPAELEFRIVHSECNMIIVSGGQSKKLSSIRRNLNKVEKVVYLDQKENFEKNEIFIGDLFTQYNNVSKEVIDEIDSIQASLKENDYANICYTSGTTADPKGIILSHLNYYANVEQAITLTTIPESYKTLLILPLDHSFAHTAGIYSFMKMGASIAAIQLGKTLNETLRNIPINIREIKPSLLMSVPSLAKKFKKNIENGIREKGPKVEKLFNKALALAIDYNGLGCDKGKGLKILKKPLLAIYDKLIFSKIRENFGGELKYFIGGGALLDMELQKFFYAIGMPMYQGYGLTEAAPIISSNTDRKHKMGSSGYLAKNLDLKIIGDKGNELPVGEKGEIVVRGENVMLGYWKNDKATQEVLKDGWLFTGDMGYMDSDGFLFVLGRFKSLLIGNDGEKYSPESIEEAIVDNSNFIDQCMLHNNQDAYTIGLIVPNMESIKRELRKKNVDINSDTGSRFAIDLIVNEINDYKTGGAKDNMFPDRWLPASFAILKEGFTEQNHMMNSTLKIVRGKINDHHKDTLDFLYTPDSKNPHNKRNLEVFLS